MDPAGADAIVLFGITGDLAKKKLIPALYGLTARGKLDMPVVGVGRSAWDDDTLRAKAHAAVVADGGACDSAVLTQLESRLGFVSGGYDDPALYATIAARLAGATRPLVVIALPPMAFGDVIRGLVGVGLHRTARLMIEKPFGHDLASARELNALIGRHFPEEATFRIDHFLGKEAVQNLLVFRFGNALFEPAWNREHIARVEILMAEDFGTEGRGGFYDPVGAIRDVVQNHLLQILCLIAMDEPASDAPDALRDEIVRVLHAIAPLTPERLVRGQYVGYRREEGVDPASQTETYAAALLGIDTPRWAGVPFMIRTGKALAATLTEVVVEFGEPRPHLFSGGASEPNRIRFGIKPDDRIIIEARAKEPGPSIVRTPMRFSASVAEQLPGREIEAYERLFEDALDGDQRLFMRQDAVEAAWAIVDPVLDDPAPVRTYPRGSWGPIGVDTHLDAAA